MAAMDFQAPTGVPTPPALATALHRPRGGAALGRRVFLPATWNPGADTHKAAFTSGVFYHTLVVKNCVQATTSAVQGFESPRLHHFSGKRERPRKTGDFYFWAEVLVAGSASVVALRDVADPTGSVPVVWRGWD